MPRARGEKAAIAKPPKALVQIIWDGPLIKSLLKLVKANPSYRQALFPSGNARISASRVTPEICIELFKEKSKPWLKDAQRRGLLIREERAWKPTVMWNSSFNDPVVTKTNALRSEYAKTCKTLKPMKIWKKWSDVESRITQAKIQEACPYFFELGELLEAGNDDDSDVEIPLPAPHPPARAVRRDTPPWSDGENRDRGAKRPRRMRSSSGESSSSSLPEIISPPRKRRSPFVMAGDSSDEDTKPVLSPIRRPNSSIASMWGDAQARDFSRNASAGRISSGEDDSSSHSPREDVSSLSSTRSNSEESQSQSGSSASRRSSSSSSSRISSPEDSNDTHPASEDLDLASALPKSVTCDFFLIFALDKHQERYALRLIHKSDLWTRVLFRADERSMKRWEAERDVLIQVLHGSSHKRELGIMLRQGFIELHPTLRALDQWTEDYANPIRIFLERALRELWLGTLSSSNRQMQVQPSDASRTNDVKNRKHRLGQITQQFEQPKSAQLLELLLGPCALLGPSARKPHQWIPESNLPLLQHPLTYLRWARENQVSHERVPPKLRAEPDGRNASTTLHRWRESRLALYVYGFTSIMLVSPGPQNISRIAIYCPLPVRGRDRLFLAMRGFLCQTRFQMYRSVEALSEAKATQRYAVYGWVDCVPPADLPRNVKPLSMLELCELVDRSMFGAEASRMTLLE